MEQVHSGKNEGYIRIMTNLLLNNNTVVKILDISVHAMPEEALIEYMIQACQDGQKKIVAYVNVYAVNLAYDMKWFKDFLNQCDLVFCDGFGVKWAAKFLYGIVLYRHTPPDWIRDLAVACVQNNLTMYFLGANQGVAEKAALVLTNQVPGVRILGTHHGYFNKSKASSENQAVLEEINVLHPNILVVGFGMPTQEKWIMENWSDLNVNVAFPVGALFDYVSGSVYRVPRWMTDHGLEWLGRLIIEPHRLWRRYIIGNPVFLWRVLLQRLGLLQFK